MLACTLLASLSLLPASASAAGMFGPDPETTPSVFTYAYRGFTLGAVDGLSAGYLVARHDGFHGEDWKPLVYGLGIGALSGSALGLTLGFVDLAADRPGRGNLALRDMVYGAGFGALAGAVVGGLVVIRSEEPEHILLGTSIGALSGTALGLVIGLIEGRRIVESPAHRYRAQQPPRFTLALERAGDVQRHGVWMPCVRGSF